MKELNLESLCDRELLEKIFQEIQKGYKTPNSHTAGQSRLYDNKSLMALLGIKDKYLKKLRDNGYLGYSRQGDKYWYTQEDVNRFLKKFHYDAFAVGDSIKKTGGGYV